MKIFSLAFLFMILSQACVSQGTQNENGKTDGLRQERQNTVLEALKGKDK